MPKQYWPSACPSCPMKERCSPSDYRRIRRWEPEAILETMQRWSTGSLAATNRTPALRRASAEHCNCRSTMGRSRVRAMFGRDRKFHRSSRKTSVVCGSESIRGDEGWHSAVPAGGINAFPADMARWTRFLLSQRANCESRCSS